MLKLRTLALAVAVMTGLAPAFGQLPDIADQHIWGRIGNTVKPGSGPSQAIPFGTLAPHLGIHTLPEIYAADAAYGMKCDGTTDDSASLQLAVNAAAGVGNGSGAVVVLPAGTCEIYSNIYRNTFTAPGVLTVPGIKIRGQGRGVTILDSHVANDFVISANPAWRAAHQAAFGAAVGTSGALATNTYYLQITANDGLGSEISVTIPKAFSVTGPAGSISITLPALSNPGYSYNLYCDTVNNPVAHYCSLNGQNATAKAAGQTLTITGIGSAVTIPTAKAAVWQEASISNLSVTNASGTANASGISYFKVGYSDLTNVYLKGLTGDGFGLTAFTGDSDGSFNVAIHNSKFDTINGTCVNAAGPVLELTNFTVDDRTAFNKCGTQPANIGSSVTVSAIPNGSSPVVTTSTAHNFLAGDQIAFNVSGITLASSFYRVGATVTSNSFNLVDQNGVAVDTTSLGSFTSGTVSLAWRPPQIVSGAITGGGGCLAWQGLIGTFKNLDFTQCNNFAMYFSEAGSSDNATIENVDFENTAGKGLYAGSVQGGSLKNFECLGANSLGKTISCVQLGTGFASGGVQNFLIDVGKVRIDSATTPVIAFEQFQNTNIGATFQDTIRVRNITWQTFDGNGQSRVSGFVNDPVPGNVQFSISAANTAKLIPIGYGGCLPLHLKSPGEWVCYHVPAAGITGAVTGGLTPATSYNCYASNSAANSFPYAIAFECNAVATLIDKEGFSTKSTDTTRTFIGTATTDGSGNFQAAGAQTSWYPATGASAPGNFVVAGNLTVVGTSSLNGIVTDGNGFLSTNIAAPSTPASGLDRIWTDSTDKRLHDKNDAGSIGTTVVADTGASNNFLTAISAAGAISKAQPAFSNLSGQATLAQLPNMAANTSLANATSGSAVPTAFAMPSCSSAASALNWTTNTGFGCNGAISTAIANVTGLGTGIATALGVNVGTAGAPVINGGALGTPSSGTATNLTGTAASLTAGTVTTNANLTGDVTSSGNATTLTNAPVIAKVLTGYTSGAGTVSATDSILAAIQKLNGNDALALPKTGGTLSGNIAFSPTTAGVTGTTTNDNAPTGTVGEHVQSSATNNQSTVTISNASPGVITQTAHTLTAANNNCSVLNFTTTGGLPTGLTVGTNYYMTFVDANTYKVSTSVANCLAGTFVNTSSAGSGTHTVAHNAVLATTVAMDITGISLTAGDWDVTCEVSFNFAATTTMQALVSSMSTTSATFDTQPGRLASFNFGSSNTQTPNGGFSMSCPTSRFSLSGTTTIFQPIQGNFGVSTLTGSGIIRARRAR